MTTTADARDCSAGEVAVKRYLRPGTGAFTLVLAMGMAVTALGVDTVLPAFPEIRQAMGLASDSNDVAGLITFFLMGSSVGLLPAGLLADRYGRLPVMYGGLALYVVGAVVSVFAPSLGLMFLGRFVWGLGSAGPRVAAMAMVRDSYSGEQMAKQMSFIMAVFLLVPALAPSLAAGILALGPWQLVFWLCAAAGVGMAVTATRLPETLDPADRTPLDFAGVWASCRTVVKTPGTMGYVLSMTALFAAFLSYLSSSEIILDEVFDMEEWFPVFFGAIAAVMGISVFINGRVVVRIGLDRLTRTVFMFSAPFVTLLLILALATDGRPGFWPFLIVLGAVLFAQQMLIPNLNAAGMRPLAHVAGTGSAILGMVPGVGGSIVGMIVDRQFDGSITPMCLSFAICTALAIIFWRWAVVASKPGDAPAVVG